MRLPYTRWLAVGAVVLFTHNRADAVVVDRIAAIVDDHIIFASEVEERAEPALHTIQEKDLAKRLSEVVRVYRDTCESLIDELLAEREAERMQITETDDEINASLALVAKDRGVDLEGLMLMAVRQGYTERSYRAAVRAQLLQGKLLLFRHQWKFGGTGTMKPEEELAKLHQALRVHVYIEDRLGTMGGM